MCLNTDTEIPILSMLSMIFEDQEIHDSCLDLANISFVVSYFKIYKCLNWKKQDILPSKFLFVDLSKERYAQYVFKDHEFFYSCLDLKKISR